MSLAIVLSGCVQSEVDQLQEKTLGRVVEDPGPVTEVLHDCGSDVKCIEKAMQDELGEARCAKGANSTAVCIITEGGEECAFCCNEDTCERNSCGKAGFLKPPSC